MIEERYRMSRLVTVKRPDKAAPSGLRRRRENPRWDVAEPISMPTLVSRNISSPSTSSILASGPSAARSKCSCASSVSCMPLPLQPERGGATAKVSREVRGKVVHIRLPGTRHDCGSQVYIVLLLRGVALNVENELLARLRVLHAPLLLHHRRQLGVVDMAAVTRLVGRIRAVQ